VTTLFVDTIERLLEEIVLDLSYTPFGVFIALLLVSLLALQELLRAHQGNRAEAVAEELNYITHPLLVVFLLIVIVRVVAAHAQ
jgi:ABC-type sulfate transport system permease component